MKRFWSKVDIKGSDECWEWQAGLSSTGYGVFCFKYALYGSHQMSFALSYGFDPKGSGWLVCHTCENNRACCNPRHLYLGTYKTNAQDAAKQGRSSRQIITHEQRKDIIKAYQDAPSTYGLTKRLASLYGVSNRTITAIAREYY